MEIAAPLAKIRFSDTSFMERFDQSQGKQKPLFLHLHGGSSFPVGECVSRP
jgi:hypothetical protein